MSFLKNKFSLSILRINEDINLTQREAILKLESSIFKDPSPLVEFADGFVDVSDMFIPFIPQENAIILNGLVCGYRFDKKSIPSTLLKKVFKDKIKEIQDKEGVTLSREEKKTIKEDCKKSLLSKVLAKPKAVTWFWDMPNNIIYLNTDSPKVLSNFEKLFRSTFELPESSLELENYGLNNKETISDFLEWIWKETEDTSLGIINQKITFKLDINEFNFKGPHLTEFMEEIDNFKKSKRVKNLSLNFTSNKHEYLITLSNKNTMINVEILDAVKHENVETAILDNLDHIENITKYLNKIIQKFLDTKKGEK